MRSPVAADPLWYKDAVIYEVPVVSFFDANHDGYGDFEGLRQKLPYLESLGVNTLWLLPFLESPLLDLGYDISDYYRVLPTLGTLDDFKNLLDTVHQRGMRLIVTLPINHTSDRHPWFEASRDPTSPFHEWYVWSETNTRYADARVVFADAEVSNWTWDRKAGKYYWHRFFSHQPDLNYDNPEVRHAIMEVVFYWLDLGVDGIRLNGVPYLFEEEDTLCEDLPRSIAFLRQVREAVELRYGLGRVLVAEPICPSADASPRVSDVLGGHMPIDYGLIPRLFMALGNEDRRPILHWLEQTRELPPDRQWAILLRNHDELSLAMMAEEEREYMLREYAAHTRFRINSGIRRRLTPLLGGSRRRVELMFALLLSLPGTPILYYGDEIGMGDDPFLGDRNGVRTPMQWSPDRNGGFSKAPLHKLFLPAINSGRYSYEFTNVEYEDADPQSLLNFVRRLLATRRRWPRVFGQGSFRPVQTENPRVLTFVRSYEGAQILVLLNLSRHVQSVLLPVSEAYQGYVPVDVFGKVSLPAIRDTPYHLTTGPHGFYWLVLEPERQNHTVPADRTLRGRREPLNGL